MRWLVEQATAHVRQEEGVMMAQMRGGDDHDKTKRDTTLVEMEEKRWEEKVIAGTMRVGKWEKRKWPARPDEIMRLNNRTMLGRHRLGSPRQMRFRTTGVVWRLR